MRKLALFLLLASFALAARAAERPALEKLTIAEFEQTLAAAHKTQDAPLAKQLTNIELTERMSTPRLAHWQAVIRGEKSRAALLALADASAFLDLPSSDIPSDAPPSLSAQAALLSKAQEFAGKTASIMPDFLATQDTIHFTDGEPKPSRVPRNGSHDRPLHVVGRSTATVQLIQGREELAIAAAKNKTPDPPGTRMTAEGAFGSILNAILKDALAAKPVWSHWERGPDGLLAVYRYTVPRDQSHYAVQVPGDPGMHSPLAAYRGEIALNPLNGTILRLTVIANLSPIAPVSRADLLVEYGPVDVAGKIYTCPLKSVAVSLSRPFSFMRDLYGYSPNDGGAKQLQLNDVVFRQYHLFRSEARILSPDLP